MFHPTLNRRQLLCQAGMGFGALGLCDLMVRGGLAAPDEAQANGLNVASTSSAPHFEPRAKAVIWLFINGGPSHVDTFDYKPELARREGQSLSNFDKHTGFFADQVGGLMKSPFRFSQYGECGKWVSELFPKLADHVDKMAFIHSGYTESNNHSPALYMMNCGLPRMGFPSVGSWVTYGLGSENENLPAFVVMSDPLGRGLPKGQSTNWSSGFLPSTFQGTWLKPQGDPIDNLKPLSHMDTGAQRRQIDLIGKLNGLVPELGEVDRELETRIKTFELAYRMQSAAPEAFDISQETQQTYRDYGLDNPLCRHFGHQCLLARRMVERGVRFVQIYSGGTENDRTWDAHIDLAGNHKQFASETDQPIAALLEDMSNRGLLESTLVVWGGEFGRLPIAQTGSKPGRDHNPHAYTCWLAGAGVKGGVSYGETDEVGFRAAVDKVHVNDLHATMLHLLGIEHTKLTYTHNGRPFRLTDVGGRVIKQILA